MNFLLAALPAGQPESQVATYNGRLLPAIAFAIIQKPYHGQLQAVLKSMGNKTGRDRP
jgi:hypothetical protein